MKLVLGVFILALLAGTIIIYHFRIDGIISVASMDVYRGLPPSVPGHWEKLPDFPPHIVGNMIWVEDGDELTVQWQGGR